MLITSDAATYSLFRDDYVAQLAGSVPEQGQPIVWHHQLHPHQYQVDTGTPETVPYIFPQESIDMMRLVRNAGAIMRRFVVIHDRNYALRAPNMPIRYAAALREHEQLYIARYSRFVGAMGRLLGWNSPMLGSYIASAHTDTYARCVGNTAPWQ